MIKINEATEDFLALIIISVIIILTIILPAVNQPEKYIDMELTLTRKEKIIVSTKQTKTLEDGLKIEYYGDNSSRIEDPSHGIIKKDAKGFYIEWEDIPSITRLDYTRRTNIILENIGFVE